MYFLSRHQSFSVDTLKQTVACNSWRKSYKVHEDEWHFFLLFLHEDNKLVFACSVRKKKAISAPPIILPCRIEYYIRYWCRYSRRKASFSLLPTYQYLCYALSARQCMQQVFEDSYIFLFWVCEELPDLLLFGMWKNEEKNLSCVEMEALRNYCKILIFNIISTNYFWSLILLHRPLIESFFECF